MQERQMGPPGPAAAGTAAETCAAPLQVGDVLYMPKGTVHQAVAVAAAGDSANGGKAVAGRKGDSPPHSAHLTLSTYNRWA